MSLKTKRLEWVILLCIGTVLILGGVISTVVGNVAPYYDAFYIWSILVISVLIIQKGLTVGVLKKFAPLVFLGSTTIALTIGGVSLSNAYGRKNTEAERLEKIAYSELGSDAMINANMKQHIDRILRYKDANVIEEYWGLYGAVTRKHANVNVDSVIHALGSQRELFAEEMNRLSDVVISTNRKMAPPYQPWLFSVNFWFYEILLKHYRVVFESPTVLWWERHHEPIKEWREVKVAIEGDEFVLVGAEPGFYKVTLEFDVTGGTPSLVLVDNGFLKRRLLSLNPSKQKVPVHFPVNVKMKDDGARFKFGTQPEYKNMRVRLTNARAWSIPEEFEAFFRLEDN